MKQNNIPKITGIKALDLQIIQEDYEREQREQEARLNQHTPQSADMDYFTYSSNKHNQRKWWE